MIILTVRSNKIKTTLTESMKWKRKFKWNDWKWLVLTKYIFADESKKSPINRHRGRLRLCCAINAVHIIRFEKPQVIINKTVIFCALHTIQYIHFVGCLQFKLLFNMGLHWNLCEKLNALLLPYWQSLNGNDHGVQRILCAFANPARPL